MNDSFKLSANSYIYRFLMFCSSWFFTSWFLPAYKIKPKLKCLDSVCTLVSKLVVLAVYLLFSGLTLFYSIEYLIIFPEEPLKMDPSINLFKYMGIVLPFVFLALVSCTICIAIIYYLSSFLEICIKAIGDLLPDAKGFKLFKQYSMDKSNGLCRPIDIVDLGIDKNEKT